jgi:hypothetical protein
MVRERWEFISDSRRRMRAWHHLSMVVWSTAGVDEAEVEGSVLGARAERAERTSSSALSRSVRMV